MIERLYLDDTLRQLRKYRELAETAAIGEEKDAIEDIYEPFLIQIGFLDRTPRGRVATARAYEYFGLMAPRKDQLW